MIIQCVNNVKESVEMATGRVRDGEHSIGLNPRSLPCAPSPPHSPLRGKEFLPIPIPSGELISDEA